MSWHFLPLGLGYRCPDIWHVALNIRAEDSSQFAFGAFFVHAETPRKNKNPQRDIIVHWRLPEQNLLETFSYR